MSNWKFWLEIFMMLNAMLLGGGLILLVNLTRSIVKDQQTLIQQLHSDLRTATRELEKAKWAIEQHNEQMEASE